MMQRFHIWIYMQNKKLSLKDICKPMFVELLLAKR